MPGTGAAGDVDSPPPTTEVKAYGRSARGSDLWLEARQVQARRSGECYVYVVENARQGDPAQLTLEVPAGQRHARLLERAKEQRYYTVPSPVPDHDAEG